MKYLFIRLITACLLITALCLAVPLSAQKVALAFDTLTPLIVNGSTRSNAWAGGLNAGQFSTVHLNNDEVEDLVVFDRTTNKLSAFVATPQGGTYIYQHKPFYEAQFPQNLQSWVLLADYNYDGRKDIFTHTNLGIKVYKNISTATTLQWELAADPLESQGFSGIINLYVSSTDIPAIVDVDSDGDLDIFTFDDVGGSIEFHMNRSKDKTGNTETLDYQKVNACWGKLRQSTSCDEFYFNVDCGPGTGRVGNIMRVKHTGSSLLLLDLDGDGDKDLLNGHTGCDNLTMLTNQGSSTAALFTGFTAQFPADAPISYSNFPAVYYEDLDFDGKKDLLSAPNMFVNEVNMTDFAQSGWFYKNTGTASIPQFELQKKDFLQATMLDVGENAYPALADYDADGDMDLFVGNRGKWDAATNKFYASLALYENTGTAQNPVFTWSTDNYLNMASLGLTDLKPYFLDVNGDRVTDLAFTGTDESERNTSLRYIPNGAPQEGEFNFSINNIQVVNLPLTASDSPLLYDMDGDKDLDALVGQKGGNVAYYLNTGSLSSPVYTLENELLGGLPADIFAGYLAITLADLNGDNKPDLLAGDRKGNLQVVADIVNQLDKTFTPEKEIIWNEPDKKYTAPQLNGMLFPATADINGDNLPEVFVGTQAGGIVLLNNLGEGGNPDPGTEEAGLVFPNPTDRYLYLNLPSEGEVAVYSLVGQLLLSRKGVPANQKVSIDLQALPAGVYLVKILSGEVSTVKKIVLFK